jgi:hypothetical protein
MTLQVITSATSYDLVSAGVAALELGQADALTARFIAVASAEVAAYADRVFALETVQETFYSTDRCLRLSRYPVTAVASVTQNGATIDPAGYMVDTAGMLTAGRCWAGTVTIIYTAGYALPDGAPLPLQRAVLAQVAYLRTKHGRDPMVRSIAVPGVIDKSFFAPGATAGGLCAEAAELAAIFAERGRV